MSTTSLDTRTNERRLLLERFLLCWHEKEREEKEKKGKRKEKRKRKRKERKEKRNKERGKIIGQRERRNG